jgi:hypothetical protein
LAIRGRLAARDPANTEWQRKLSGSHNNIGSVLATQRDGSSALAAFRTGLAITQGLVARDPANTGWQRDLLVVHKNIGHVLRAQGDGPGALATYRTALAIAEGLAARDPAIAEWQRDLILCLASVGEASGDKAYAVKALDVALAMQRRGILATRAACIF